MRFGRQHDPHKLNNTVVIKTVATVQPGVITSLPRFAMAVQGGASSVLTWSNALGCALEQTLTLNPPQWIPISTNPPGQNSYTVPFEPGNAPTFYRLRALAP